MHTVSVAQLHVLLVHNQLSPAGSDFQLLIPSSSPNYFNVFCHVTLKKSYLWCYLQFNIKLYLIGKGKEYPFGKKNISVVGNP